MSIKAVAATLLFLALQACSPPPPSGHRVDATAATSMVLSGYLGRPARADELPAVYIVEDDVRCSDPSFPGGATGGHGFVDTGACHGGLQLDGAIYMVDVPAHNFSHYGATAGGGLPHELLHWIGKNHDGLPTWPAGSPEDAAITAAQAHLASHPEIDRYTEAF